MDQTFEKLSTVKFQQRMKPFALEIYKQVFPGCEIEDLRENGFKVHVLDKEFGIDSLINLDSNQWISLQEKYRKNDAMKYLDFTQEYMNAVGTENESEGEWFKLGAQLYFYGWANKQETAFERWFIMDIVKYKMIVEECGGLENIGTLRQNRKYGRASFYSIPLRYIKNAIIAEGETPSIQDDNISYDLL